MITFLYGQSENSVFSWVYKLADGLEYRAMRTISEIGNGGKR